MESNGTELEEGGVVAEASEAEMYNHTDTNMEIQTTPQFLTRNGYS